MPYNYILPERDDMISLVFQTEPKILSIHEISITYAMEYVECILLIFIPLFSLSFLTASGFWML